MKEIEATCYFCPSECSLLLSVDEKGSVCKVRRKPVHAEAGLPSTGQARCSNLQNLRGLHIEKAKAILRSPRIPRIIVGGH